MCWLWSAASTSFATCVLAFSKFSVMQQHFLKLAYIVNCVDSGSDIMVEHFVLCVSVPLRSRLKSCSLLISATSLLLSVCSRFSLLLLPCISVS